MFRTRCLPSPTSLPVEQTVLRKIDPRVNLGEDGLVVFRSITTEWTTLCFTRWSRSHKTHTQTQIGGCSLVGGSPVWLRRGGGYGGMCMCDVMGLGWLLWGFSFCFFFFRGVTCPSVLCGVDIVESLFRYLWNLNLNGNT